MAAAAPFAVANRRIRRGIAVEKGDGSPVVQLRGVNKHFGKVVAVEKMYLYIE